jgi:hypothetical protein
MYHILTSKGPKADPAEIASHFNVIMMAGAVTTATFLAGVTYYLGHNKHATFRLQQELRSRFNSLDDINSKELLNCEYLNAVVEEGLRIYPPAGAGHLSRIVPPGGCEIDGEFIPEGVSCSKALGREMLTRKHRRGSQFINGRSSAILSISGIQAPSSQSGGSRANQKGKEVIVWRRACRLVMVREDV